MEFLNMSWHDPDTTLTPPLVGMACLYLDPEDDPDHGAWRQGQLSHQIIQFPLRGQAFPSDGLQITGEKRKKNGKKK